MHNISSKLNNAINLIKSSKDFVEINDIIEEMARLTHTTLLDNISFEKIAMCLEKNNGNKLMIKLLKTAEIRFHQITELWSNIKSNHYA